MIWTRMDEKRVQKGLWLILLLGLPLGSSLSYCPQRCMCVVKANLHILMNCSNADLRKFPTEEPSLDFAPSAVSEFHEPGYSVEIDLSRNFITEAYFPSSLKQLKRIDLSYNRVVSMNDVVVVDLEDLKELDLSHNERLETLSDLRSSSLEILKVAHCSIGELEQGFLEQVPSVKSMDISHNSLVELGRFVTHSPAEEEDEWYEDFGRDEEDDRKRAPHVLLHLNVSHNKIRRIRGKDAGRSGIKVLDVSDNEMTDLRFTAFLRHLEELNLSRNSIESLDGLAAPSIIVLDLSENNLRYVRVDFHAKAPELRKLDLSRNPIQTVPQIKSSSIRDLDLSFCEIDRIEAGAFSRLLQLDRLSLAGNKLTALDYSLFSEHPSLRILLLGRNPWRCDCDSPEFRTLLELVLSREVFDRNDLGCQHDPSVTWPLACRDDLQEPDLMLTRKQFFYFLLYLLLALFAMILTYTCWRLMRNLTQRASHSIESSRNDVDDNEIEVVSPPALQRQSGASEGASTSHPPLRRSTPPPNYETAILLPQLSEEDREKAISSLSLHVATDETPSAVTGRE